MKFKFKTLSQRKQERLERRMKQHSWITWYPVQVKAGEFHWLTTIQRRLIFGTKRWEYAIEPIGVDESTDENFA